MHNDDIEATHESDHDEVEREAVTAADDTGMVGQQEILANIGIGEAIETDPREIAP